MMDPVVSSKFGKRPLLEMPALHVESDSRVEISSLQPRPKNDMGMPSMIYRSDGINVPAAGQVPSGMPGMPVPMSAPAGLPPIPGAGAAGAMFSPQPGAMFSPQPGAMYSPQPGAMFSPQPGAGMYQQSPYPMMPPVQPPLMYPNMHPPYQGQGYAGAGGAPPAGMIPPSYPNAVLPRTPVPPNFHVEGVLQYGQLTTVHFRDKTSNFRGIPEYLRLELMKTYGQYPATDIRIVAINGQYHIYASPRHADEVDEFGDYSGTPMTATARMVGFNEVRGRPRTLAHGRTL